VLDLDTLVEHPSYELTARLGEGNQCSSNADCARVMAHRYTSFVEQLPDRSKEEVNDDGSIVVWFKPGRAGSRGTTRHRTCLPKVNECRCNATSVCEGVDGVTMLAASIDNMIRPMLDRSHYEPPTGSYNADIERLLARITPARDCGGRRADTPARAIAALTEFAERHGALALLERRRAHLRAHHAALVDLFMIKNSETCVRKGDGRKCAG
jgi:hypothetical protein